MKFKSVLTIIVIAAVAFGAYYVIKNVDNTVSLKTQNDEGLPNNPLNATFLIEDKPIKLTNGKAEQESAPGSVSKILTSIFGETLYGDLNDDGKDDAAMILVHQTGGNGTFYYAVVAINNDGYYRGTNAVFLGDRISPQNEEIRNGILMANYADRKPGEAMVIDPSVGVTKYMSLKGDELVQIAPLSVGESVLFGFLTFGHEARIFKLCASSSPEYWIGGNSSTTKKISDAYDAGMKGAEPYTPIFAVVSGKIVAAPKDGFGADYDYAIEIGQIVRTSRTGSCVSDFITVSSPLPGSPVKSPLKITGMARGQWFPEGTFPISLADTKGKVIATTTSTAKGELDTEEMVPFEAIITFEKVSEATSSPERGSLILKSLNPSDKEFANTSLEIPVNY